MNPNGIEVPGNSRRLHEPKFQGMLQQHIRADEQIIDTADAQIDIFDGYKTKPHWDLALVLTTRRLLGMRARGVLGSKPPLVIELSWLDRVGVTANLNVSIEFTGEQGRPGLWKLHLGDEEQVADRWMHQIHKAAGRVHVQGAEPPVPQRNDSSPEWEAMRARLTAFGHALAPFVGRESIGRPLGEGLGLEAAQEALFASFESVEQMRLASETMAVTILTDQRVRPEDLDEVMGLSALRENALTQEQAAAVDDLAGAAKTFLHQFDEPGASVWELWKERDDVAGEFLCWHTIAWARLATIGKVEPL